MRYLRLAPLVVVALFLQAAACPSSAAGATPDKAMDVIRQLLIGSEQPTPEQVARVLTGLGFAQAGPNMWRLEDEAAMVHVTYQQDATLTSTDVFYGFKTPHTLDPAVLASLIAKAITVEPIPEYGLTLLLREDVGIGRAGRNLYPTRTQRGGVLIELAPPRWLSSYLDVTWDLDEHAKRR